MKLRDEVAAWQSKVRADSMVIIAGGTKDMGLKIKQISLFISQTAQCCSRLHSVHGLLQSVSVHLLQWGCQHFRAGEAPLFNRSLPQSVFHYDLNRPWKECTSNHA